MAFAIDETRSRPRQAAVGLPGKMEGADLSPLPNTTSQTAPRRSDLRRGSGQGECEVRECEPGVELSSEVGESQPRARPRTRMFPARARGAGRLHNSHERRAPPKDVM